MKKITVKKKILLTCLLTAVALPTMADNFYVFGDVGQGKYEVDGNGDSKLSQTDTSFSIGAGYDINKFLAIEVAYRDLGKVKDSGDDFDDKGDYFFTDSMNATALQASLVGKLPVNDVFSVYGRVGVANIEADFKTIETHAYGVYRDSDSDSKTRALFGIGASYDISPQVALRAEYNQYAKWDDLKLSSLTVGAVYKF